CPSDSNVPPDGTVQIGENSFSGGATVKIYGCDVNPNATPPGLQEYTPTTGSGTVPFGVNSYAANYLVFGALATARLPDSIPDGTSKTIFFTEKTPTCGGPTQVPGASGAVPGIGGNLWAFPPFFPYTTSTTPAVIYNYAGAVGFDLFDGPPF